MSYLFCINSFFMNDSRKAFTAGNMYQITHTEMSDKPIAFMVDSDIFPDHLMPWDEEVKRHFIRCITKQKV